MPAKRQDVIQPPSRSFWKEKSTERFSFFCPLCKASRFLKMHPRPGHLRHFAQVGVTTALLTALTMHFVPWIGLKMAVAFVPLWIAFESVYRAKVRASTVCQHCGFDAFLYLSEPTRAREAVREHWKKLYEEKGLEFPEEPVDEEEKIRARLTRMRATKSMPRVPSNQKNI